MSTHEMFLVLLFVGICCKKQRWQLTFLLFIIIVISFSKVLYCSISEEFFEDVICLLKTF